MDAIEQCLLKVSPKRTFLRGSKPRMFLSVWTRPRTRSCVGHVPCPGGDGHVPNGTCRLDVVEARRSRPGRASSLW
jgi:hypothetical protein